LIGTKTVGTVAPGNFTGVSFTWTTPPNPPCLNAFNTKPGQWTFLAHLNHPNDPLPQPLIQNPSIQSYYSNNITVRTINLITAPNIQSNAMIFINDSLGNSTRFEIYCAQDKNHETILDYGDVILMMSKNFIQSWVTNGENGEGIVKLTDSTVQIISPFAYFDHVTQGSKQRLDYSIEVQPFAAANLSGGLTFDINVAQFNYNVGSVPSAHATYLAVKDSMVCEECEEPGGRFSTTSNSIVIISDTLHVMAADTLIYNNTKMRFLENAMVYVHPGGKLILDHCQLESYCNNRPWRGITAKSNSTSATVLSISSCIFKNTSTPIIAEKIDQAIITDNAIIGESNGLGTGISLEKCKNYEVRRNRVARFATGMKTSETYTSSAGSAIENNNFQAMQICLDMSSDGHATTDIRCNTFNYLQHGMRSSNCTLKNFGNSNESAGNRFISHSSQSNDKFTKTGGNSPSYYYDLANPITSGMSISTNSASAARNCLPADTSSSRVINDIPLIAGDQNMLMVVPNPNTGKMTIKYHLVETGNSRMVVSDLQGRIVFEKMLDNSSGQADLDMTGYSKGVYFVNVSLRGAGSAHGRIILNE
jgi:hypothetical protein